MYTLKKDIMVVDIASKYVVNATKQPPRVSIAPTPRTLNVQKFAESRASELESLHSIVSDRLNNDFRSRRNKRRRTTGYDNRVTKNSGRKRKRNGFVSDNKSKTSNEENIEKKVPRHVRRSSEFKKNPETGFCTSGDGTKRLRTHVWHAKRFTMTKLWGFHLPLGLHGSGRGSRALLKWYKNGALVHDASHYGAIQLEGPEDSLLSVLESVLVPSPSNLSKDSFHSVISGLIYGKAMLHCVGSSILQLIAPVNYMWRPIHQQNIRGHNDQSSEPSSSSRLLWVWIHASAFSEGYDALKFACVKQMNKTGIVINCSSLEGQLAKLEVMGLKSFQLLQKILHPEACVSDNAWKLNKCSSVKDDSDNRIGMFGFLENEENVSSHGIKPLTVVDPRTFPKGRIVISPNSPPTNTDISLQEDEVKNNSSLNHEIVDSALWDSSKKGISPPFEENFLCMEKHHLRMKSFCLEDTNPKTLNNLNTGNSSRSCPILLLKDTDKNGSLIGWSIILPISWVKAFWIPLVSNGARAIGLREKHWISSELGLPYFPSDFPESPAYSNFKQIEAIASNLKAESRPLNKIPMKIPILPPWNCVRFAFDDRSNAASSSKPNVPFEGLVARTTDTLTNFSNETCGGQLLLCPFEPDKNRSFSKFRKDETKVKQGENGNSPLNKDRKLCFVRVLLHAYKDGNFEEGAVVCAPQPTDVKLWTSISENNEGLQMPQSLLNSYFEETCIGNWELHIPDDPISSKFHRWQIGFVTTGFVRGSKKPRAGALCEATLLSRIRVEQWKEIPCKRRKKEIYVIVRNLRSTAYRLALATIVLEQQQDDLEFT